MSVDNTIDKILSGLSSKPSWLSYRRAAGQIRSTADAEADCFSDRLRVALVGSFTLDPLADFLVVEAAAESVFLETYIAPYGQCSQELLNSDSGSYTFAPDFTLVAAEADALANDPPAAADQLLSLLQNWKTNSKGTLLACTFIAAPDWPLHALASPRQVLLQKANQHLKEALAGDSQVQVLDLDGLAAYTGYAGALSPEMMAMARVPFSEEFLKWLARKIVSHIKAAKGWSKKCLVLDCDNTLWGGIVGEDGFEGIALGPDWPGREFVDFQKAIFELYEQGVILAVNSKNNASDVMEVFRRHRHMVLREDHIAAFAVNWQTKVENMQQLARQLNIGLDSMVFVDDNPAERQIIRQMLPQVEVLDLPGNPAAYARLLRQTSCFTKLDLSEEDRRRGQMYAAQRRRDELQKTAVSLEDFLKSLEMVGTIRTAKPQDVKRAAQLTQRTNQFNLTTRRYTEPQIQNMLDSPDWGLYVMGLKDRFGDNGTVGLVLVEKQPRTWRIDTFLMSCRVIGRQAEDALLDYVCRQAADLQVPAITAEYIQSPKNALVADFWSRMGFAKTSEDADHVYYELTLKHFVPKTFEYLHIEH